MNCSNCCESRFENGKHIPNSCVCWQCKEEENEIEESIEQNRAKATELWLKSAKAGNENAKKMLASAK